MSSFNGRGRGRKRKRDDDLRPKYIIYSDGSANSKGGAGYAALIYRNNTLVCHCAGSQKPEELTTNNQAELMAIQLATYELVAIDIPMRVTFFTDSQYSVNMLHNNFKPKANEEIIEDILDALARIRDNESHVSVQHVPRTEKHIVICDSLANKWRKKGEFTIVSRKVYS